MPSESGKHRLACQGNSKCDSPGRPHGFLPRTEALVHLAESGDSVPRWVSRKCNMLPKSALLRLWRGSRGSIRYAKALLASKGRETHAGSQGSIDSTFA